MKTVVIFALGLLVAGSAVAAAADLPQGCAGFAPPYTNKCGAPVTVWYKPDSGGPVKTVQLAPGQSGGERVNGAVMSVVCRQGETAYEWQGGAHGNTPWRGGGYKCRK